MLFQVDKLEGEMMVSLAELLIKGVKEGHHHALELFPKLLAVISSKKTIHYRKGSNLMTHCFVAMPTQGSAPS